ncbi:MAG: hypothetical protein E7607_09070 [Ruminococcaceae bacterium]|nr:hypothetical protein [Oscillospiraceae bacterium]
MKSFSVCDILLISTVGILLFAIGISIFILPKPQFSEAENKYLASFPSFSFEKLKDGSFSRQLSLFCSDRIPARQSLIAMRASGELMLGKRENNGIIFGKGGYLIPRGEYSDPSTAEQNLVYIDGVKEAADAHKIPFACALAPRSIDVMSASLPSLYGNGYKKIWDTVLAHRPWIHDMRNSFSGIDGVWYKTDHHWTTEGAFLAYSEILNKVGDSPFGKDHFTIDRVSTDFFGTSHSRVGGIWGQADCIDLYRYEGDKNFSLSIPQSKITKKGFYYFDALESKDKYSVFMGGNYGFMSVTKDGEDRKELLLIKDSYANSVIPFLAIHYDLTVIDPRYFTGDITEHIQNADSVIVLLGIDTLATMPLKPY